MEKMIFWVCRNQFRKNPPKLVSVNGTSCWNKYWKRGLERIFLFVFEPVKVLTNSWIEWKLQKSVIVPHTFLLMQTHTQRDTLPFSQRSRESSKQRTEEKPEKETQNERADKGNTWDICLTRGGKALPFGWKLPITSTTRSGVWLTSQLRSNLIAKKMTHGWFARRPSENERMNRWDWMQVIKQKSPFFIGWLNCLRLLHVTVSAEVRTSSKVIFRELHICCHWLINKLHRAAWNQPEVNCTSFSRRHFQMEYMQI